MVCCTDPGGLAHTPWLPWQVRYTAVRRQTAAKVGEKETQVLNYQNTAFELLPLLGSAYALVFMVCANCSSVCLTRLHMRCAASTNIHDQLAPRLTTL